VTSVLRQDWRTLEKADFGPIGKFSVRYVESSQQAYKGVRRSQRDLAPGAGQVGDAWKSAVPNPSFFFSICCSGSSFYPFEDWPLNTVFYADEQKLDSNVLSRSPR
jgi:hypothetical protein